MKLIGLIILIILSFNLSAQKHQFYPACPHHKDVTILLFNNTGYDIDSLALQWEYIGFIKNQSTKEYKMDYYSTHGFPVGKIAGLDLYPIHEDTWCGYGAQYYCDTILQIEIKLHNDIYGYYLTQTIKK